MTAVVNTALLCTILTLAGIWRWNERKNADPAEHNQVTGRGMQA